MESMNVKSNLEQSKNDDKEKSNDKEKEEEKKADTKRDSMDLKSKLEQYENNASAGDMNEIEKKVEIAEASSEKVSSSNSSINDKLKRYQEVARGNEKDDVPDKMPVRSVPLAAACSSKDEEENCAETQRDEDNETLVAELRKSLSEAQKKSLDKIIENLESGRKSLEAEISRLSKELGATKAG